MYTYFCVMNDFGIRPRALWKLATIKSRLPNPGDKYDPDAENLGNTNLNSDTEEHTLGWDLTKHAKIDIRLFYARDRTEEDWTSCRWDPNDTTYPEYMRISHISERPICYSTEALKYA